MISSLLKVLSLLLIHGGLTVVNPSLPPPPDPFQQLKVQLHRDGFDSVEIVQWFQDPRIVFTSRLARLNISSQEHEKYYQKFLDSVEIQDGVSFYQQRHAEITELLTDSIIPVEIIVALLKVESDLGRKAGHYPLLATFATIYVLGDSSYWAAIPDTLDQKLRVELQKRAQRRAKWAYQELTTFLQLCKRESWDPPEVNGSWAGAFGWAQFIPSSFLHYARDGNGDGKIEPETLSDAVASIANYLKEAGWGRSIKSHRRALLRYNRSHAYVDCILEYSQRVLVEISNHSE